MKILVAGGAGFIGSVLVPVLVERGYDVTVIDALWFGNFLPAGVKLIRKSLFDCGREDLEGYEQIIFLAGVSNDPMAEYNPARNFVDNGALPAYLAYTAKKCGVRRFIYASSCSVYGYTYDKLCDEDSPAVSAYPYGISKLQGEKAVLQLQDDSFSTIALRQGTVCGWSPRMRFDLIVNTMYKTAVADGRVRVDNASIWRPLLDIRDAASAFTRAVQANDSIHGVFNVASGNYTVGQVGDLVKLELEKRTGAKIRLEIKDIADFRNYKVSCEKAKVTLGFEPQFTVQHTIDDLYDKLRGFKDFEKDQYYNIRMFKQLDAGASKPPVASRQGR